MAEWLSTATAQLMQGDHGPVFAMLLFMEIAVLCGRAARLLPTERRAWMALMVLMLALGYVRLFAVIPDITAALEQVAVRDGWYAERARYQKVSLGLLGMTAVAASIAVPVAWRRKGWALKIAAVMSIGLTVLTVVQAMGLNRIDAILGHRVLFASFSTMIMGALAITVGVAALIAPHIRRSAHQRGV